MPPAVIPAIGVAANIAIGQVITATVLKIALSVAVSVALSALSSALAPKPKTPQLNIRRRDNAITVRQPVAPRQVVFGETAVGGTLVYVQSTDNNQFLHLVVALTGHEVEDITTVIFGNEEVPLDGNGDATGKYAGLVRVKFKTGTDDQTAFSDLITESGGEWTENHRLRGCAAAYVRLKFNADKFPSGIPLIRFVVKGFKAYDPRVSGHDSSDPSTWEYTTNPALLIAAYLNDDEFGLDAAYTTEIDDATLIAAANVCDETITLAEGGTEPRYSLNGSLSTDIEPKELLPALLSAMAGRIVNSGGKWFIQAGAYTAPTVTLDEGDLRAPIRVSALISRRDNFNSVRGTFIDPDRDWQETDFPPLEPSTFIAQDSGQQVFQDLALSFTQSQTMAQRLSKIALYRVRQPITVVFPANMTGWQLKPGDTVAVDNANFGWDAKVFEVVRTKVVLEDDGALGCDLVLRETAPEIYDWTTGEEQAFDPAPATNLPDPFTVANPTALRVTTEEVAADSNSPPSAVVSVPKATWTAPADQYVTQGGQIRVQWKLSSESVFRELALLDGDATEASLPPQKDGVSIDVRVRSINSVGVPADVFVTKSNYVVGTAPTDTVEDWGDFSSSPAVDTTEDWGDFSSSPAVDTSEDWGDFSS